MNPHFSLPARDVHLLARCLEERGTDCAEILAPIGIDREQIRHPDAVLRPEQIAGAIRALVAMGHTPELALLGGMRVNAGALGELGRAMLCCATGAEAMALCARFYGFISMSVEMQVSQVGEWYAMRWVPIRALPHDIMLLAFEMTIGAMYVRLTSSTGSRRLDADVYLSYPPPDHAEAYGRLCPARYHFGQGGLPALRMEVPRAVLDRPQPTANPDELFGLKARLALRLASMRGPGQWTEWTAMMLREALGGWPTQKEVAAVRNLSASTLGRHLAAEGASFRQLSNQIRLQRAQDMLLDGRWSISHIAEQLGYAHATNFVRAFRAEFNCSPLQYANDHQPP